MAEKQLIIAIEGTAAMGPYWNTVVTEYLEKIIRCFCANDMPGQKLSAASTELSLVVFTVHGSYCGCLVQRSGWTRDADVFLHWLSAVPFSGGGFIDAAVGEGLAEALMMFSLPPNSSQSVDMNKHCILVAASNPYSLPTPVYRPQIPNPDKSENKEVATESSLADAETVARSFAQCSVSLSVISPRQLPKLREIYNAGKRNPRAAEPAIDVKNPYFLVLLSEHFMEARAALSRAGITNMAANQSPLKMDTSSVPSVSGPLPTSIPSVNGSMTSRQSIPVGNTVPATVKVEPNTIPSSTFPHPPSVSHGPQGITSLQSSPPSSTSQEMITNNDNVHEFKPMVGGLSQPLRPTGPAAANVNILNNLSQVRQAMNSANLNAANSMGLQTMGATPMAMHMSNMISSGMASNALSPAQNVFSPGQSGNTALSGSGSLVGTTQIPQNTTLGGFSLATSSLSVNPNQGMSQPMANLQGPVSLGQSATGINQGNLTGGQIGQSGIGMNQNIMNNGLGQPGVSAGSGTMIPTPGVPQQVQAGIQPLGVSNTSTANMPQPAQQTSGAMQSAPGPDKYVKVWEGALSGQRQGQPVFITKLE
ncbi:hypothetical protein MKW94_001123, partial [Papaver nudicaule]|nr:hypothetical protein [Papaver nudicaule]